MGTIKVGINGFGRIGRLTYRALLAKSNVEVVAINDLTDAKTLAHLFKYDSVHGKFNGEVSVEGDTMVINGRKMKVMAEKDPANLPWATLGVDIVVECTGIFRTREKMSKHLTAGAKKVVLSVPSDNKEDVDATIVLGVNDNTLTPDMKLISNASCTTNCLAPIAKVLNDSFGIKKGLMNTIHSYTNDQIILDAPHRIFAVHVLPLFQSSQPKQALQRQSDWLIPELDGKMDGFAVRVPTPDGSIVDLTCELSRAVTKDEINAAMKAAANGPMKGVLEYLDEPLVSCDIIGNPHSSIYDSGLTKVLEGTLVKVISWYDNEYGYSCRLADLVVKMG